MKLYLICGILFFLQSSTALGQNIENLIEKPFDPNDKICIYGSNQDGNRYFYKAEAFGKNYNISGFSVFNDVEPNSGWMQPLAPIAGSTATVKFLDSKVARYQYSDNHWNLVFVHDLSTSNGLMSEPYSFGQSEFQENDPAKLNFNTVLPMNNKSIYWKNNGVNGFTFDGNLDGKTTWVHSRDSLGGIFIKHKPNTLKGNSPLFSMAVNATDEVGHNFEDHANYVFTMGLNMPENNNTQLDTSRGGLSMNWEGFLMGIILVTEDKKFI
jgi:hypothetical protein